MLNDFALQRKTIVKISMPFIPYFSIEVVVRTYSVRRHTCSDSVLSSLRSHASVIPCPQRDQARPLMEAICVRS